MKRLFYFDYLRALATIAVILTHVAADVVTAQPAIWGEHFSNFNIANFFDTISRFAVNIFFMISGALLLNEKKPFNLKKQWFKVFIPLALWSVAYVVVNIVREKAGLKLYWGGGTDPVIAFKTFFAHQLVTPLWFVYSLLGLYLAVPLLRAVTMMANEEKKRKLIEYLLVMWALSTILLPTLQHFWPNLKIGITNDFMPFFLGLMLLGYYLNHYNIKWPTALLMATWLITNIAMFIIIYYDRSHGDKSNWAWGNHYPFVFFNALSIFLFFKDHFNREGSHYKFICYFSLLSFQIYLAHAMVLGHVFDLWPASFNLREHALVSIPLALIITTSVSFLVAHLIHQIDHLLMRKKP